jgi:P-type Cu+ transporter
MRMTKKTTIKISGMHCASCVKVITKAFKKTPGVARAVVNYSTEKGTVEYDPKKTTELQLLGVVKKRGYSGYIVKDSDFKKVEKRRKKEVRDLETKVIISAIFGIPALILGMFFMKSPIPFQDYVLWSLATPVQFYIGKQFYQGAWAAFKNKTTNMDTLIAIGTSAAYFYSVYVVLFDSGAHQYFEASAVLITLVVVGQVKQ